MTFGFDIQQGAVGAESLRTIMAAPSATEADIAKNKLETKEAQGTSDYMDRRKATQKPAGYGTPIASGVAGAVTDPGTTSGKSMYGIIQMTQDMQKQQKELDAEEENLKSLSPTESARQEATIQRKQQNIDKIKEQLIKESDNQLGENYSVLDAVKTPQDYDRAKSYFTKQNETMADQAGLEGEAKKKFVQDNVEKILGKSYDPKGLEIKKNGMIGLKEQIAMKRLEMQTKSIEKQTAAMNLSLARQNRAAGAKLAGDSVKGYQLGLVDSEQAITNGTKELARLDKENKDLQLTIPKQKIGGFMGMGKSDNPQYAEYEKAIQKNQAEFDIAREEVAKAVRNRDLFRAKLRQHIGIDDEGNVNETPSEEPVTPKVDSKANSMLQDPDYLNASPEEQAAFRKEMGIEEPQKSSAPAKAKARSRPSYSYLSEKAKGKAFEQYQAAGGWQKLGKSVSVWYDSQE